jgi:hypothetical protein
MKTPYIKVDGIDRGIDFDAHYRVRGWRGVAFFLLGWSAEWSEPQEEWDDTELEPNYDSVIAVMVGDDRRHVVDVGDLEALKEDAFCRSCGQIGCRCNVYT